MEMNVIRDVDGSIISRRVTEMSGFTDDDGNDDDDDAFLLDEDNDIHSNTASYMLHQRDKTIRQKIFLFLDDPTYSRWSFCWLILVSLLVFVSFICQCLISVENLGDENVFLAFDIMYTAVFTIDYFGRLFCAPNIKSFVFNFMNTMDLLSILPFYLRLLPNKHVTVLKAARTVRLARLFRLYKVGGRSIFLNGFLNALKMGSEGIVFLLSLLMMCMFIFSSMIYYLETAACELNEHDVWVCSSCAAAVCQDKITPFQSIPESFWWFIVTFTSVGYGDHVPITTMGKVAASVTMIASLIFLAFPVTLLSGVYGDAIREIRRMKLIRKRDEEDDTHLDENGIDRIRHMVDNSQDQYEESNRRKIVEELDTIQLELTEITENMTKLMDHLVKVQDRVHALYENFQPSSRRSRGY